MTYPLNLDVSADHARALHRVVRAMHDGHCPKCGHLGPSNTFSLGDRHECPVCAFAITSEQARSALDTFKPHLAKSVEVFEQWCKGELPNDAYFNQFGYLHSTPKSNEPEE